MNDLADDPGIFDRAALLERVMGDTSLAREVLDLFLASLPVRIAALRTAWEKGDQQTIRAEAHAALSFLNVSFSTLCDVLSTVNVHIGLGLAGFVRIKELLLHGQNPVPASENR